MNISCDDILCGNLRIYQPLRGPRVNLDTILLSSWVNYRSGHRKYLEACSATGAISLILARKYDQIEITGLELQSELVSLANQNAAANKLSSRVKFLAGDLRDDKLLNRDYYDVLVINPPYSSENGQHSPDKMKTIARQDITCKPEDVGKLAYRVLRSKGRIYSIFTCSRLAEYMTALKAHHIAPKRLQLVYSDQEHEAEIFLLESIKDGGIGMTVMKPLLVRDLSGNYTPEVLRAYELPQ